MKKLLLLLAFPLCVASVFAQQEGRYSSEYKPIIGETKQKLLNDMDVIANMRFGFNNYFVDGSYDYSKFNYDQFRFEFRGKVHEKVSFRLRNRYTREPIPGDLDNLTRSADLAFIQLDLSERHMLRFGKMCADWGGVEFDLNPIDVYMYNDILEYADNFLSGVQYSYTAGAKKNNQFTVQLLNSRTQTFGTLYPSMQDSINVSDFAGAGVLSWRGKLLDGFWETLWSYSVFHEAQSLNMNYFALGNWFNISKKLQINYDFKFSNEDLDRKTLVTQMAQKMIGDQQLAYYDAQYMEHWLQINYHITPKWTFAVVGMTSAASWGNAPGKSGYTKLRDAYGVIPSIEYYPYENLNLRFFVNYIGRFYEYTDFAKTNNMQIGPGSTGQVNIGFISPLLIL
jgi:hypothetical protein